MGKQRTGTSKTFHNGNIDKGRENDQRRLGVSIIKRGENKGGMCVKWTEVLAGR